MSESRDDFTPMADRLDATPEPHCAAHDTYFTGCDECERVATEAEAATPEPTDLCDHPCTARVLDSGGWSCSRCEQFCGEPCATCLRAATPEPTDPPENTNRIWRQCVCGAWYWGAPQTDADKAHSRVRAATPEATDLRAEYDKTVDYWVARALAAEAERDAHRCTVDEAALAAALADDGQDDPPMWDILGPSVKAQYLKRAAAIAARLRGES